jgi:hypothetical protein
MPLQFCVNLSLTLQQQYPFGIVRDHHNKYNQLKQDVSDTPMCQRYDAFVHVQMEKASALRRRQRRGEGAVNAWPKYSNASADELLQMFRVF